MTADRPWSKWYWDRWRSDPALRMCSLSARGLWMEMLCVMDEADPRGHLLVNGIAPTDAQLAVLAGAPLDQLPDLLGELETTGVFSRTRKGVIYSRRMTRDEKKAKTARKNGSMGGNPSLGKDTENHALDNPKDKAPDNPKRLETRRLEEKPTGTAADAADVDAGLAFEGEVIRLKKADYERWRKSYPHIDLTAELTRLDDWYAENLDREERKRWFTRCSAALANANGAAKKPVNGAVSQPPKSPEEHERMVLGNRIAKGTLKPGHRDWHRAVELGLTQETA